MQTIKIDSKKTGWVSLPGDTHSVVAHFEDNHKEKYSLVDFLVLKPKVKNMIVKIDCYKKGEIIKDK